MEMVWTDGTCSIKFDGQFYYPVLPDVDMDGMGWYSLSAALWAIVAWESGIRGPWAICAYVGENRFDNRLGFEFR